jgi:hypothetical protein
MKKFKVTFKDGWRDLPDHLYIASKNVYAEDKQDAEDQINDMGYTCVSVISLDELKLHNNPFK